MMPFKKFLLEGGAAGHMAHPFDLLSVNRGSDLISFFKKAYSSLKRSKGKKGFVKFDGVNVSIKLIQDDEGNFKFALDRGSNKELDIQGITTDNIAQRFDATTAGGKRFGLGFGIASGSKTYRPTMFIPILANKIKVRCASPKISIFEGV